MGVKANPQETAKMIALCAQQLSAGQIAKKMGLSRNTVIGRLRRAGVKLHRKCSANCGYAIKWTPEQDARLRELRAIRGLPLAQITRMIGGASYGAIHDRLAKLGIKPPHRRPSAPKSRPRLSVLTGQSMGTKRNSPIAVVAFTAPDGYLPLRDADGRTVTLLRIREGQCKFIYGEAASEHCCAHPTAHGSSWCDYHFARVFRVAAPMEAMKEAA